MAKNEFESLLERAPDYAPALAGLANTYNLLGFYELAAPNDVYPKAKNAAIKAVALNRNLVEAQTALAYYETVYDLIRAEIERSIPTPVIHCDFFPGNSGLDLSDIPVSHPGQPNHMSESGHKITYEKISKEINNLELDI